ncbi:nucleotidyltransferase domain-containing protein [Christensenellaceae bacterium OttesenSCG-928-K19]|nr:nucleotidyltransferase domain-containing protein [Christensenellaceae bacterium OttesenSCG-928-K19]
MTERDLQLQELTERAKELECLYAVDELLQDHQLSLPMALAKLVDIIPIGFTDPQACRVRIYFRNEVYSAPDFEKATVLCVTGVYEEDEGPGREEVGRIEVGYLERQGQERQELLEDEEKLLHVISRRVSQIVLSTEREIHLLVDMLQQINPDMLEHVGEKLNVHMKDVLGIEEKGLSAEATEEYTPHTYGETNTPLQLNLENGTTPLTKRIIENAVSFLPRGGVFPLISKWVQEERIFALVKTVDDPSASIGDVLTAVYKYIQATDLDNGTAETSLTESWLTAELSHRFLSNDSQMLNLVLDNIRVADFAPMLERIIGTEVSRGNIGGKGAGLFIAQQILRNAAEEDPLLKDIKTPHTWYVATDKITDFLQYNNMKDLNAYKYNSAFYLRMTYDDVVSKIKRAKLPPRMVNMLRVVLDDLEGRPLIVRSSSLLEDSHAGAFSGKYKSLFLANQGPKEKRLQELMDAILEVYSSMYNPDSISYRKERGLLNSTEQMGILIQEVVGRQVGKYYMPVYAGVAFSHNLFRWSTRINRDGGLVRLVMGLGTRAVDRVNDDYPVLFSPEKPELRVNQTPDDIRHYSPKQVDLIDLERNRFETMDASTLLWEYGDEIPDLYRYISVYNMDIMENRNAFTLNTKKDDMVVTFDSLLSSGELPKRIKRMLDVLQKKMQTPVDIEFAFDGDHLYLLQCRPQGEGAMRSPAPIPQNLEKKNVVFTANRFISDGQLHGVTHIVYVDGDEYDRLSTKNDMLAVGKVIGLLNEALPKRQFILIGPGRWGSRGDIKLGVRVTYSDISSTAALIEVAKKKASYTPVLSFGTHFFQDLVEADILYIPLYPDQKGAIFRESFFRHAKNSLEEIVPEYAHLSHVVKVIDVPAGNYGKTLSIHMNSNLEKAVAFLTDEEVSHADTSLAEPTEQASWKMTESKEHWQWRYYMAKQIADNLDMEKLGVKGIYLFGSTNTGNSSLGSDIDLLLHIDGNEEQRLLLRSWLDGWSQALAKINFLHTGYDAGKLLDYHLVTDRDIENKDPYAQKINSVIDPIESLRIRT